MYPAAARASPRGSLPQSDLHFGFPRHNSHEICGEPKGRGDGSLGVGPSDGKYALGKRAGGEEVEAAVEAGKGYRGLEFEGGESKLEVKARMAGRREIC